jgi:hypothetical protein
MSGLSFEGCRSRGATAEYSKGPTTKLYITYISPYARLARILVLEKAMSERVDIVEAKTRA